MMKHTSLTRASLLALACVFLSAPDRLRAEEPALPMGLGGSSEPSLPAGLGSNASREPSLPSGLGAAKSEEPALPAGLGVSEASDGGMQEDHADWREGLPFDLSGFAEARIGKRLQDAPSQKDESIEEVRLQLKATKYWDVVTANVTADILYDPILEDHAPSFETGDGWLDLREANLLMRPLDNADLKVGRQILTWGTGDLIFINDMFPKDWNAFFIGRDEEYLKAPSDAAKFSLYHDIANLDVVYTPRFDHDRYIDGRRISYYNGNVGQVVGGNRLVFVDERDAWFDEDELSLRLHRLMGAYETALYYYNGYWKSPNGQNLGGLFTFPKLSVYGASVRGPLLGGIANMEAGYYDSRDDSAGNDPLTRNSEWRFLIGYERELMPELTGAVQYYLERMDDHDAYLATLPAGAKPKDENRHLFTLRLTKLLMNQNLTLSLFNFYSPSDEDGYVRPKANYKIDDHWTAEVGGNIFYGEANHTFFGQFEDNTNIYAALRYGF